MYKLNLHCHTRYSDGSQELKRMVEAYKSNGFPCAIFTDHFYPDSTFFMKKEGYMRQITEAHRLSRELDYPIICGIELAAFYGEEVLVFGTRAILDIFDSKGKNIKEIREERKPAMVLCHPSLYGSDDHIEEMASLLDGFEHFNSGQNMFKEDSYSDRKIPKEFKDLTPYSNSDAHGLITFMNGYNVIDKKITTEEELIEFIRSKPKNVELHARHLDNVEKNVIDVPDDRMDESPFRLLTAQEIEDGVGL